MLVLIEYVVICSAIGYFILFLSSWLIIKTPLWRNISAFVIQYLSSFVLGFVFYTIKETIIKHIALYNTLPAISTWSIFAIFLYYIAWHVSTNKIVLFIPYALTAFLFLFDTFTLHRYNLFFGVSFLALAFISLLKRKSD